MKALITGIAGFAGSHLAQFLLSRKIKVYGFFHSGHSIENIDNFKNKLTLVACNLLEKKTVEKNISNIKPDLVFHLAAFSSPPSSFNNPKETFENNVFGQLNLLESLVGIKSKAKILVIGSADEYGNVDPSNLPIKESAPLAPISPYAVSKVAQDMLGLQFFLHHNLNIVRVRPFNHIGPRQSANFVVSAFASQIAQLEKKDGGTMEVGNLEVWRDFTDVRDMVRAYLLALEMGKFGEVYNIGTGKAYKIGDILDKLVGFVKVPIKIRRDKKRWRRGDIKIIYPDISKFRKATGWKPKIPLSQTLFDTIEYERSKIS